MGVMQFKLAIFQEKKLRLKFILVGRYFHVIALMAFKEPWFLELVISTCQCIAFLNCKNMLVSIVLYVFGCITPQIFH